MKRKKKKRRFHTLLFLLTISGIFLLCSFINQRLIPPLKEISHIQCKTILNQMIDEAVIKILDEANLNDKSNFVSYTNNEGYIANTAFINRICSQFSHTITQNLQKMPDEKIEIPFGAVTNLDFLTNIGPHIPFTLVPMGQATVDYESEILSVGINQINYKIWLNISMELKIVNPLYQENVTLERKIMLADIVFSGKVPEHYVQIPSSDHDRLIKKFAKN